MAVALLGAYEGADPSMGWLFAVGLGLQEHRRSKVLAALLPIAAGHLVSVGLAVGLIAGAMASGLWVLRPIGAAALIVGRSGLWRRAITTMGCGVQVNFARDWQRGQFPDGFGARRGADALPDPDGHAGRCASVT